MNNILQILREEIERQGSISFARFMELALYCPKYGYYERVSGLIGAQGDYFTSVSTGALFGQLLALQLGRWLETLPVDRIQCVEAGAHDGRLAADILAWLGQNQPSIADRLQYWIVEPSSRRRSWQERILGRWAERVKWFESIDVLAERGVEGVIFSNELLDAMPVHRLGWDGRARQWFEWGVRRQGERLVWTRLEPTVEELGRELECAGLDISAQLKAVLPDGFTIELSPAAGRWWRSAAKALRRGKLMTIDYGLNAAQCLAPERGRGTLAAYARHRVCADPLAVPGEQDLTAHVNFTQLERIGEKEGLLTERSCSQEQFLHGIAAELLQAPAPAGSWTPAQARQFQTLTHPEHLGRALRVLIQARPEVRSSPEPGKPEPPSPRATPAVQA